MDANTDRMQEIESRGKRKRLEMAYRRTATRLKAGYLPKEAGKLEGLALALEIVYDVDEVLLESIKANPYIRKNIKEAGK